MAFKGDVELMLDFSRQLYSESGANAAFYIGWAVDTKLTAMVFDNTVDHGQAKACALSRFFGSKEGLQNFFQMFFGHTGAFVTDLNNNLVVVSKAVDGDTAQFGAGISRVRE